MADTDAKSSNSDETLPEVTDAPEKYRPKPADCLGLIEWYAGAGLSDWQMAHILRVSVRTWFNWKRHPSVLAALKRGDAATVKVDKVVKSILRAAQGYEVVTEWYANGQPKKIKHFAPNVIAGIYYTSNRDPENWKQRQDLGITTSVRYMPVQFKDLDAEGKRAYLEAAKKALAQLKGEKAPTQIPENASKASNPARQ